RPKWGWSVTGIFPYRSVDDADQLVAVGVQIRPARHRVVQHVFADRSLDEMGHGVGMKISEHPLLLSFAQNAPEQLQRGVYVLVVHPVIGDVVGGPAMKDDLDEGDAAVGVVAQIFEAGPDI